MRNHNALALVGLLAFVAACEDSVRPTAPPTVDPALSTREAGAPSSVGLRLVAEGLTQPVVLVQPNDHSGRLFVADQTGVIRIINPDGTLRPELRRTAREGRV